MAAITITRPLSDQGDTTDRNFISAFMPATFEFTFERGTEVNSYAEVTFNGYTFRAVMIQANYATNTDLYLMDLSSILPSWIGFAPMSFTTTGLTKDLTVVINGKTAAGTIIASATHTKQTVSFGYGDIGANNIMAEIWYYGRKKDVPLYHDSGNISFYFNGAAGNYQINISGVSYTYALVNGYNNLLLWYTHYNLSGTLTITGQTTTFPIIYYTNVGSLNSDVIVWVNDWGGWDYLSFERISKSIAVENTNSIPVFNKTNFAAKAKSLNINISKSIQETYRIVAKDVTQFNQLMKIIESPRILNYNSGIVLNVVSAPSTIAECRQNLNFTITFEHSENAISY